MQKTGLPPASPRDQPPHPKHDTHSTSTSEMLLSPRRCPEDFRLHFRSHCDQNIVKVSFTLLVSAPPPWRPVHGLGPGDARGEVKSPDLRTPSPRWPAASQLVGSSGSLSHVTSCFRIHSDRGDDQVLQRTPDRAERAS